MKLFPLYCPLCDSLVGYTTRLLIAGVDDMSAEDVVLLNGEKPFDGQDVPTCSTCLVSALRECVYKSDQPVEIDFAT